MVNLIKKLLTDYDGYEFMLFLFSVTTVLGGIIIADNDYSLAYTQNMTDGQFFLMDLVSLTVASFSTIKFILFVLKKKISPNGFLYLKRIFYSYFPVVFLIILNQVLDLTFLSYIGFASLAVWLWYTAVKKI